MKISSRIDGSIYGAILSSRPSRNGTSRPTISIQSYDYGATSLFAGVICVRKYHPEPVRYTKYFPKSSSPEFWSSSYSTVISSGTRQLFNPTYFTAHVPCSRKWSHTSSDAALAIEKTLELPLASPPPMSKEELIGIVDQYDGISVEEHLEFLKDPYMRRYAPPDTRKMTVTDSLHHLLSPLPEDLERGDDEVQETVTRLRAAVLSKLLKPHTVGLDTIYGLYCSLPEPRIPYLPGRLRHQLMAALAITERRNSKSMLRYFAVVADIKTGGFALSRTEWNTAMSFASRYVGKSTTTEAEAVLHLWRQMEHEAGIKGNEVTFNILFDVASKAGKFPLAEMIYHEMNTRGYEFNRYHHVSLIHFFGLKKETHGVRAAYKEMVEAGEIIDSVVLNSLIASFLRAGEESAAERVYEKMKKSDQRSRIIPDRDYTMQKKITRVLMMFARVAKKHPDLHHGFQRTGLLAPDLHTYRLLVNHFGVKLGDMSRVAQYLDEMKWFRVPLHGALFLALFKAFSIHGAPKKSDWSLQRLESVWGALLDAYDTGAEGLYISTWMMMWALRAFTRCSQSQDRILEAYDELSSRWNPSEEDKSFMLEFIHRLLKRHGLSAQSRPKDMTSMSGSYGQGFA